VGAPFRTGAIWVLADDRRIDGDDLDRRIAAAKKAEQRLSGGEPKSQGNAENRGMAVGIEFVGAVLVSAFIGWLLDRWLGTKPWLMIVLLLLGFAAGLRRAIVTSSNFDTDPTDDHK
jgi:ATP synthase protein I